MYRYEHTDHLTQFLWHHQQRDRYLEDPEYRPWMSIHQRKDFADWHQSNIDGLVQLFRMIMADDPERVLRDWMPMCYP